MTSIRATKNTTANRPYGVGASFTLARQIPLISATFPEITKAHHGTINLYLDLPLLVIGYDHRTSPLIWDGNGSQPEVFDFVRVELEVPSENRRTQAWLYVAHASSHRQNLMSHEIITLEPFHISDDGRCILHIPRNCVSTPHNPIVVIT